MSPMHQTMAAVGYVVFGAAVYLLLILLAVWSTQNPARWLVTLGTGCSMLSIAIPAVYIVRLIFRA